eukprot:scaffold374_cov43-Prasinocladus_malaysianus.AAC.1
MSCRVGGHCLRLYLMKIALISGIISSHAMLCAVHHSVVSSRLAEFDGDIFVLFLPGEKLARSGEWHSPASPSLLRIDWQGEKNRLLNCMHLASLLIHASGVDSYVETLMAFFESVSTAHLVDVCRVSIFSSIDIA